jgi:hypothetical protein
MKSKLLFLIPAVLVAIAVGPAALAHHSRAAIYDMSQTVEFEGTVSRILWRNPHIRIWLEATIDGELVTYEVESTPPGTLERHGIGPEILRIGQRIRLAGPPGRYNPRSMEARNILLPDGREVLIQRDSVRRWSDQTVGWADENLDPVAVGAAETSANGIFRVWSRDEDPSFKVREGSSLSLINLAEYPLTAAAQQTRDNFDPVADNPIPGCTPKGMPHIMGQPYPIEFIDDGEKILLRIEEYDLTRIIYLTDEPIQGVATSLGFSIGRWDGEDLVVSTFDVLASQYTAGIPLGASAEIEERFQLSDDKNYLNYSLTVTDPVTFTEPVTREKYWRWIPGVEIDAYECTVENLPEP